MATSYSQPQPAYRQDPPVKPQLPRSISMTNLETTRQCQDLIQKDWCFEAPPGGTNFFTTLTQYTFTIPSLSSYPPEFRQFVFYRIIDRAAKKALEEEKCLNWCPHATQLEPMYTMGDGNCLLHAASLGMWGFQDRSKILRNAVSHAVVNAGTNNNTLYQRWRYTKSMEYQQFGLQLDQQQWQQEWQDIVRQASTDLTPNSTLESLEEFHVFVLSNVLRRPVIMYASQKMRSIHTGGTLQHTNFHGIYLPLLWDPQMCCKDPLPLAYQGGHFSTLIVVDFAQQYRDGQLVLPLVTCSKEPLPVRFMLQSEHPDQLVREYLSLVTIPGPDHQGNISCATLNIKLKPTYYDRLVMGFIDVCHDAFIQQQQQQQRQQPYHQQQQQQQHYQQQQQQQPQHYMQQQQQHYQHQQQQQQHYQQQQHPPGHVLGGVNQGGAMVGMDGPIHSATASGHAVTGPLMGSAQTTAGPIQTAPVHMQDRAAVVHPREPTADMVGGQGIKCINDCGAFGDPETGLCSKCYKKSVEAARQQERPAQHPAAAATSPVNSGITTSLTGSIKCPDCSKPGHPNYLGMCETCYHNTQLGQKPSSATQPHYGNQPTQTQYGNSHTQPHYGNQPQYGNQPTHPQYGNQPTHPQYGNQPTHPQYGNQPEGAQPLYTNEPANPQHNLYESIEKYQDGHSPQAANQAPPPVPPPRSTNDSANRNKCRTPNCEFFGTVETRFYCSKCFEKNMEAILKEVDTPPAHTEHRYLAPAPQNGQQVGAGVGPAPYETPLSTRNPAPQKCTKCHDFFGSPEYNGLCHTCFLEGTQAPNSQKCPSCKDFFGNEEYGGLCHSCFMKRTMAESTKAGNELKRSTVQTFEQEPSFNLPGPAFQFSMTPSQSEPPPQPPGYISVQHSQPPAQYPQGYQQHNEQTAVSYSQVVHAPPASHANYSQVPAGGMKPTPKPRTQMNTQSLSPAHGQIYTAPVAGMETMSISDPATVSCFICRGSSVDAGGSYSVCPQHAKIMTQHFMNVPYTSQEQEVKRKPQHPSYEPQQHMQPTPGYGSAIRPMQNTTPHAQPGYGTQPPSTLGMGYGPASHAGQAHSSDVRYTAANSGNPGGIQSAGIPPMQHYPQPSGALNDLDTHTAGSGVFARPAGQHAAGYGGSGGRGTAGAVGGGGSGMNGGASPIISGGGGGATGGSGIIQGSKPVNPDTTNPQPGDVVKLLCKTPGCSFYPNRDCEGFCHNCYEEYYGEKTSS